MSIKALWNDADAYTEFDGGPWISTSGIHLPPANVYSLRLSNGNEWDAVNGIRISPKKNVTHGLFQPPSESYFIGSQSRIPHSVGHATYVISHEELKTLSSGGTIYVGKLNDIAIHISLRDGQVDAVRESIAKAKSRPASRE